MEFIIMPKKTFTDKEEKKKRLSPYWFFSRQEKYLSFDKKWKNICCKF